MNIGIFVKKVIVLKNTFNATIVTPRAQRVTLTLQMAAIYNIN
jgi:hypothetical protein